MPCGSQRGAERDRLEKYGVLRLVYGSRFSNLGKYIWQAHFAVAVFLRGTAYCGGGFGIPLSLVAMLVLVIVRKGKRKKTAKIFGLVYMWIVTFVVTVQTFNCFVIYHCSSFAELNSIPTEQHTRTELEALGNKLVTEINALSKEVERDSEGKFVLTADLDKTAQEAMRGLGSEFKNLGGFYVTPKAIKCSFFMSQMDLMGIYFPFSMEANYNQDMYKAKLPDTICHELAHTKGYIQEDEANFIAFMACDRSDNADYRYSGYLAALGEVRNKILTTLLTIRR